MSGRTSESSASKRERETDGEAEGLFVDARRARLVAERML